MSTEKNNKKIKMKIIIPVVIILAAVLISIIPIRNAMSANRISRQISLGQKYLEELDYEQAAASFLGVLEIDDRNVDAYLGLAEAYAGMGDRENAAATLEKGIALTDDESLKVYLKELQEQWALEDAPKEPEEETVENEKITVIDVINYRSTLTNDGEDYSDIVLLYSDFTESEPISGIKVTYGKLTRDEANGLIEMFAREYDDYTQKKQDIQEMFAESIICPVCASPCLYLSGGQTSSTSSTESIYTVSILEYCESCEQLYAIGYEGEK